MTKDCSTRREIVATLGLASGLWAGAAAAQPASEGIDATTYEAKFPGAVRRPLAERLSDRLSVLDFGARGDGVSDDTEAFRTAADAAARLGKTLYVPTSRGGYVITDTVELRVRRICGEGAYFDPHNPGTRILFRPRLRSDMKPCFAIIDGMYGAGLIEDLAVFGNDGYATGELRQWVDPALLPDYAAFASGVCAFAVLGANQPTFRNVVTRHVKAGLYLDSTDGHVSSYDCEWSGLFGIYCHRNSEDYFFLGGSITGVWAGVVFGTFEHAGHNGGMQATIYRVHLGYAPYGFYQVKDADFANHAASLYGRLDMVRFEQIGEAIFQFLPESVTDALMVDNFGFSWSRIHRGYPKPSNGWASNLPGDMMPYDEQQKFAMRFGTLARDVKLGWLGGAWLVSRSQWATAPGGVALIQRMELGEDADLAGLGGDYVIASPPWPSSSTRRRAGGLVRQGDLALNADVVCSANLLSNPELVANWQVQDGELASLGLADTGTEVPLALREELGDRPVVLKLAASGEGAAWATLSLRHPSPGQRGRNICIALWFLGERMRCRLGLSGEESLYDATYHSPGTWQKVIGLDQGSGQAGVVSFQISTVGASPVYVCGLMASLDSLRPYTPLNVPSVRLGLALEDISVDAAAPAAGDAAPLPGRPAGYVTIKINGVDRRMPYY